MEESLVIPTIEEPLYFMGISIKSPSDVDTITQERIDRVVGSVNKQFSLVRKSLKAFGVLLNKENESEESIESALSYISRMSTLDSRIEEILQEGRTFKELTFGELSF